MPTDEYVRGLRDALNRIEQRKQHYEYYRAGRRHGAIVDTHPAIFAILDEMAVLAGAMISRAESGIAELKRGDRLFSEDVW